MKKKKDVLKPIIGRWKLKQKIVHLVDEFQNLLEDMESSDVVWVGGKDVNFPFRLAREAIGTSESSVDMKAEQGESCVICYEETASKRMFFTDKCLHRHCFSCVKKHVKAKLLSGYVPTCLEYGCKFELTIESCSKVLKPKLIEMWKQKMKEDSIPAEERIYCPYPNCSMLMSKTELWREETSEKSNVRTCIKCCELFCIDCKVPSHSELSCADYKKLNPDPLVDDLKLQSLARDNMWRQCLKCSHLIELSHGCNHMTCRCGYEFCYKCGIEWKKDQQLCPSGCVLMEHGDDDDDDDDDDEGDEDEDEDEDDDEDHEWYYDNDGVRWRNFEDFIDHQTPHYDAPLDYHHVVYEYRNSPEQFFSEEENAYDDWIWNDDNWEIWDDY